MPLSQNNKIPVCNEKQKKFNKLIAIEEYYSLKIIML